MPRLSGNKIVAREGGSVTGNAHKDLEVAKKFHQEKTIYKLPESKKRLKHK